MLGPEYLSVNKVTAATFVTVEAKIPFGNKIPSSGKLKLITSPVGTSTVNKLVPPAWLVVFKTTFPAPLQSEATTIPLSLTGYDITAVAPAAVNLVACISLLKAINSPSSWLPREPLVYY